MQTFDEHNEKQMDELLKQYLLQQAPPEHEPQNLYDMSAQAVFSMSLPEVANANEKMELNKIKTQWLGNANGYYKHMFKVVFIAIGMLGVFYWMSADRTKSTIQPHSQNPNNNASNNSNNENSNLPMVMENEKDKLLAFEDDRKEGPNNLPITTEQPDTGKPSQILLPPDKSQAVAVTEKTHEKKLKREVRIPVLTDDEIAANNKQKKKMIKAVIKADKNSYARIPMGSFKFKGEIYSVNGFYMQLTEVTNLQYRTFLNDLIIQKRYDEFQEASPDGDLLIVEGANKFPAEYLSDVKYNDYPVVCISQQGAKAYCNWLTIQAANHLKAEGEPVFINDLRIPVDLEWAYAAGAGVQDSLYPWNTNSIQSPKGYYYCNFNVAKSLDKGMSFLLPTPTIENKQYSNSAARIRGVDEPTCKVFSYNPNNWLLYCMSGNVAEMVNEFKTNVAKAMGGSYNSTFKDVTIESDKEYYNSTAPSPFVGFRPVMTLPKGK